MQVKSRVAIICVSAFAAFLFVLSICDTASGVRQLRRNLNEVLKDKAICEIRLQGYIETTRIEAYLKESLQMRLSVAHEGTSIAFLEAGDNVSYKSLYIATMDDVSYEIDSVKEKIASYKSSLGAKTFVTSVQADEFQPVKIFFEVSGHVNH